jgi:hypothetical protein
MRQRLSVAEVAELAALLDDAPQRVGVVDDVLQAAAEGRGMTLVLADPGGRSRCRTAGITRAARQEADQNPRSGGQQ